MIRFRFLTALVVLFAAGSYLAAAEPVHIGSRLELFVDDYLIDSMTNVTQELHSPVEREIALAFDQPWEGSYSGYATVFKDDGLFRMYYRGWWPHGPFGEVTCYAKSTDGINWTRPNLGLFESDGSAENNIVWRAAGSHNFAPFKDANPAAPDSERYKAVGGGPLCAFASPDGVHWRKIGDGPIITEGWFDSLNTAFWDPVREQYVCYFRDYRGDPNEGGEAARVDNMRTIRVSTSKDFLNWTRPEGITHGHKWSKRPEWLDFGDAPPEHLYTNAITLYFRAPHIYMGFPKRFVPERGVSDGVFMTSRDQIHFHRFVKAFVRPGLDQKNWMQRSNMAAWGMLQTSPEEISMYYSEHYYQPTARMRRRTLRTDGFVSINAKYQGGELLTKPLSFEGQELVINYSTSAVGSVQVEIQHAAGGPIKGFAVAQCPEIFGDEIEYVVAWEGGSDLGKLAGTPVRLRFVLKDTDLYSIRFR